MTPELIVIDTIEGLISLHTYLLDKKFVAYDVETTGLTQRDQVIGFSICAEELKAFYVILSKYKINPNTLEAVPGLDYQTSAYLLLESLTTKNLIMHNGIFDCMMTESNFKVPLIQSLHTDTLVLAHLLDENRSVALKVLANKMYGESMTKEQTEMHASIVANGGTVTKDNYELYKADPYLIGKYGAKDAWLTYRLFIDLIPQLEEEGLVDFFYDESMPLLRTAAYDLNTTGIQVNVQGLQSLKATLVAEIAEAKAFIMNELADRVKPNFNLDSPAQLSKLLFGEYQLEFGTLTKGGKAICKAMGMRLPHVASAKRTFIAECLRRKGEIYQAAAIVNGKKKAAKKIKEPWSYIEVNAKILKKLSPKYKWIERLLKYKKSSKLLGTYVKGIEDRIQYGVIHPNFILHGTKTGRFSCKNPNLQNLPRDDQRVKEYFVARPGKTFIAADFSQLEPRIFASYSGDEKLMAAFDGTSDFYSVVGREVYDKYDSTPQKDGSPDAFGVKYKHLRDIAKQIALAFAYGATVFKIAGMINKSEEDTTLDRNRYFERFPGVKKMMLDAHALVQKDGFVTNIYGRKRRIPDAKRIVKLYGKKEHKDLPYEARKLLNMACNFRIQSTGASIVNRAAIRLYDLMLQAGIKAKMVSQIHDEIVIEADEQDAETVGLLLQEAMENTCKLPGVRLEAEPRISKTLAK